jgi:tetratricopeptide (TPR) repeat protein
MVHEGLALCEKVGDEVLYQRDLNVLGWLWGELGDVDRSIEYNRRCAEGARKRGDPETVANAEINVGDAFIARGELALASEVLEGVLRLVKDPATSDWMKWRYSTHLFASLGDLCLARGEHDRARAWANQCLEIATRTNARKNLVKGWRLRGQIATASRQPDEARIALDQALATARQIGNPSQLWKTHAAVGRFHEAAGRREEALAAYRAAREVLDGVRTRLQNVELRAALERAAFLRDLHTTD